MGIDGERSLRQTSGFYVQCELVSLRPCGLEDLHAVSARVSVRLIVAPERMTMPIMFMPMLSFTSPTSTEHAQPPLLKRRAALPKEGRAVRDVGTITRSPLRSFFDSELWSLGNSSGLGGSPRAIRSCHVAHPEAVLAQDARCVVGALAALSRRDDFVLARQLTLPQLATDIFSGGPNESRFKARNAYPIHMCQQMTAPGKQPTLRNLTLPVERPPARAVLAKATSLEKVRHSLHWDFFVAVNRVCSPLKRRQ